MVDFDVYNERRLQLITFFGSDPFCFVEALGLAIEDLVDTLEWEDNEQLAIEMGWTESTT